ncbi:DUF3413 domain-containing protein [Bowmanella denitrificans]|uniref:DUF3413 domain-containing protein n=1 Tax=Bowmanella denitrificans TaxID=366582 RepID=UPI000C99EA28|nr:DUF3413 domain-containing protein [Bowmanella denitrificans]
MHRQLHAFGWFLLINAGLACVISIRYFAYTHWEWPGPAVVYAALSVLGQMPLLVSLCGALALPSLLIRQPVVRHALLALLATFSLALLIVDTQIYAQFRFHLNSMILTMLLSGGMVEFSNLTYGISVLVVLTLFTLQWHLLGYLSQRPGLLNLTLGRRITGLALLALLTTHISHVFAAATYYQPVVRQGDVLPLFFPTTANSLLARWQLIDEASSPHRFKSTSNDQLAYPAAPLAVQKPAVLPDILVIMLDSWRYDAFNPQATPNLWHFAQQGVVLNNHYSSGHATRMGMFGLFYGLPGSYWSAFLAAQQTPLLIDRLQALHYQMGIFASAHLRRPEFHRTVFAGIPNLRDSTEGPSPAARDLQITREWLDWQAQRSATQPAFSLLFFDALHGYDVPADYPPRFEPMLDAVNHLALNQDYDPAPLHNRYLTAAHFIDQQAATVLSALQESGRLEHTLVIITSDHGEEFNDNRQNYWGHGSNFSQAQVKVPMAVVGPGAELLKELASSGALTSHLDLAPSLLRHYLGVQNPVADIAVGMDWFSTPKTRQFVLSSGYEQFALLFDEGPVHVTHMGHETLNWQNQPQPRALDSNNIQQAMLQMSHFYR